METVRRIVELRASGTIHDGAMERIEHDIDLEEQRLGGTHSLTPEEQRHHTLIPSPRHLFNITLPESSVTS